MKITLRDPSLLRTNLYINGEWRVPLDGRRIPVFDPASGSWIAEIAHASERDIEEAIQVAYRSWQSWKNTLAKERGKLLRQWGEAMLQHKEDLGMIITREQGKPLREAVGEIIYAAQYLLFYAEEAVRTYGDIIPTPFDGARLLVLKQPVGPVGIITPWNFPVAMFVRKAAAALAAGCTCVIKPDERTPLSAYAVMELAHRIGFPAGVLNMLTGDPPQIGEMLATHPHIRKISFTGSTATGRLLMQWAAKVPKPVTLELGGNAPFIVFDDADIPSAVEGLIASKFRNSGQTCICVNRVFVHRRIAADFKKTLAAKLEALQIGPGVQNPDVGPLIDDKAYAKVEHLVDDAVQRGAELSCQLFEPHSRGLFYPPTIIAEVQPEMDIFRTEIFGPVISLIPFDDTAQVIQMANDTEYGLAAYFYTNNPGRIWTIAEALEYGMVGINTGRISTPHAPFGGVKASGFGREGSKYGIEEYLVTKYLNWSGLKS